MTKLGSVGVGMVFLVGCAVGGAAGRFVVPPASAQQAAMLTKWEYTCISDVGPANELGVQGWELAAGVGDVRGYGGSVRSNAIWCFKRPKL
jgi:hypothetical protein